MPGDLTDAVAALLLDMELSEEERESINPFWLIDLELPIEPCPVWREHGAMLTAHFVKRHPGRRPSRWWLYDCPSELPRERLGGTGRPAWEVLNVAVAYHCGIPSAWVDAEDAEWLTAKSIAAMIDPADLPVYEAQATYLRRYHLLLRGEEKRLPADAFEPELVT